MLVGNCGGVLSPLGDPPLYMGYTYDVRFLFTFQYLYKIFFVVNGYVLLVFTVIDLANAWVYRREKQRDLYPMPATELRGQTYTVTPLDDTQMVRRRQSVDPRYDLSSATTVRLSWRGIHNSLFLMLTIVAILLKGLNIPRPWPQYVQEGILFGIALACLVIDIICNGLTPTQWYKKHYSTRIEPVAEVIVIFVGLFFTMSAPIALLSNLNVVLGPKLLFLLSSVFAAILDNAPVYISFAASAAARFNITIDESVSSVDGSSSGFLSTFFITYQTDAVATMRAISAGSVLMGACTLLGNAPNMIVSLMATRYTYRVRTRQVTRAHSDGQEEYVVHHIQKVGFVRMLLIACATLTPIFIVVTMLMLMI
ncbi:unnamed protein product [Rotaria socialis]